MAGKDGTGKGADMLGLVLSFRKFKIVYIKKKTRYSVLSTLAKHKFSQ